MRAPGLLLILLAPLVVAAPAAARTVEDSVDMVPGATHELNVVTDAPTTLAWRWRVAPDTATATFDVHTHPSSGGVTVLRGADGSESEGSVSVGPGTYSFYWQDKDDVAFRLTYTAEGDFRLLGEPAVDRTEEPAPEKESPSPAAALAAGALAAAAALVARRPSGRRSPMRPPRTLP